MVTVDGGRRPAAAFVARVAGRDLVWRARRWVIAAVGTSIALAVALLLSGFLASFSAEAATTLDALGGDGYVVREGAAGPFTTPAPLEAARLDELVGAPGITKVAPIVTLPYTLRREGSDAVVDVFLVGRQADGPGDWPIRAGRAPEAPGEVVLDGRAGAGVGDRVTIGDRTLTVVGTTSGVHVLAGKGAAWTSVADAQALVFGGAPFVSGFVYEGRPTDLPDGLEAVDLATAKADLRRLVRPIVESIETFRILMWIVSAATVGSVLFLTAVDRVRDFAVLKATGTRDLELALSLVVQAAALAVVASAAAIGIAVLLAPTFPTPVLLSAPLFLSAPVMALLIGTIGSLAGVRRALSTDPALAFGGA